MRLSTEQFDTLVHQALRRLPRDYRRFLDNVVIDVEPMPDKRECRDLQLRDPRQLMGLYHGTPITQRSVNQTGQLPDRIVLYQRNIERSGRTTAEIIEEIRKTLLHEVGHHFGLDEDDLDDLGYG